MNNAGKCHLVLMPFFLIPFFFTQKKRVILSQVLGSLRAAAAQENTYILHIIFIYDIYQRTSLRMGTLKGDKDCHGT